ncbi:MAG TPA: Dabb family protein [Candidatus Eisenbergiella merdipullorum]|uniref:Dabb family protein n=1 Tax=Candidatus Eisenbergiella merdipullorum TaxID=2838553 RepID=A0A9D2I8P4_9FIRM|nr:Dabb family protein [Candidatus Eisenbergiella merdipullorum]
MVNHIVMWNFNSELTEEERREAGKKIRRMLLHVAEVAKGVFSLQVYTNELASSNRDIALISRFESLEDLAAYQLHPEHVKAASYIKTVACERTCFDYVDAD